MVSRIKKTISEKIAPEPVPFQHIEMPSPAPVRKKNSPLKNINWGRMAALIAIVVVVLYLIVSLISSLFSWKAVFLDNGQVYFGKSMSIPFAPMLTLKKVYYVRSGAGEGSENIILGKLTEDVQGPEDKLRIYKRHILYVQTLRSDSVLVKKIEGGIMAP